MSILLSLLQITTLFRILDPYSPLKVSSRIWWIIKIVGYALRYRPDQYLHLDFCPAEVFCLCMIVEENLLDFIIITIKDIIGREGCQ